MKSELEPKHSKPRGCLRILFRGLVTIVLLIVILGGVGYAYEHYAAARDMKHYPPPGVMVEVNGHQMHLYCTGAGDTTVILEAQATSSSIDWAYVQEPIAQFTRVCSYDRAGYGWSELSPQPRTAQQAADDLYSLLDKAGEKGPYIVVGASYGGHVVRLFAHDHPGEVSGMVLVDARPEKLYSLPDMREQSQASLGATRAIAFLGEIGLSRIMIAAAPEKLVPPPAVPLYNAYPGSYEIVFQSKLWHVIYAESLAMDTSDAQVAAIGSLGDLPLIVLRHGKPMFGTLPPEEAVEMELQWQEFQEEMAKQSTASQVVVAEGSGHSIQIEQPAIIVDSVRQLLEN